jgi:23S rRNA (uracil1939-C5)-methyltransferase
MAERGTKLEVTIEKLVYGGDGLSRQEGTVVFTPYVLPGERVSVEVEKTKPGIVWARPREVLAPAAGRVPAPCPYYTWCGGCHYQHAGYDDQLRIKREILDETLRRGGVAPGEISTVAAEPWGYRNRTLFHVDRSRIGYLEARSHVLCPVETCPISSPAINRALGALVQMARDSRWPNFLRSIQIFTNETEVQLNVLETDRPVARRFFEWCGEQIPGLISGALDYPLDGVTYRVSAGSFFQVNRFLAGKLVETALEGAAGERALDLYAGVGLFSIPLARRFRHVTAVESNAGAARDLAWNTGHAAVTVEGIHSKTGAYLEALSDRPDFVLLDPPREGIGKDVVRRLAGLKPPAIAIVSCDPSTLARDLAGLLAAGYRIETLTLVDLFPQTFHIETVARLVV